MWVLGSFFCCKKAQNSISYICFPNLYVVWFFKFRGLFQKRAGMKKTTQVHNTTTIILVLENLCVSNFK